MRHHMLLPLLKWKVVRNINHNEAAKLTGGNTDKFMNKDYWLIGDNTHSLNSESQIPIGAQAVYYHDSAWKVVEKVRQ
jgi:hypothetical protein